MSGSSNGTGNTYIISPTQAVNTFTQLGGFARQKNVFIVRFITTTTGPILSNFSNLTFAIKTVDRPKANLKTEELNEYNKIRVVHTGRKYEPIKISLYDSADGAAQNMVAAYCQYYFGDVMTEGTIGSTNNDYQYDATSSLFADFSGSGFGFTANNGPLGNINTGISAINTLTADAQWFFDRIEVYHFYDGLFDLYCYTHPRISNFDLGDLDYATADVAMIQYEQLQYYPQNQVSAFDFPEFSSSFDGNPLNVPATPYPPTQPIQPNSATQPFNPSSASMLISSAALGDPSIINYRYSSEPSGGPLGIFGNFSFGPSLPNGQNGINLSTLSLGNPALTTALNIGSTPNNPASTTTSVYNVAQFNRGLNASIYDTVSSRASGSSSGYGNGASTITKGLLAGNAIDGTAVSVNASGQITLPPSALGSINAQATGTCQYGFNPIT